MKELKMKTDPGAVQKTLFLPLWARAKEIERSDPVIIDTCAKQVVQETSYDFSKFEHELNEMEQINFAVRAFNFDKEVIEFIRIRPEGVIINIGAGLDTTFQRVDNGQIQWVNIDLPDVVSFRRNFMQDSEREITIGKSVFDFSWITDISGVMKNREILFMSAGVLFYFTKDQVHSLFSRLAVEFPSSHFVFDSMPWLIVKAANLEIKRKKLADSIPFFGWYLNRTIHLKKWVPSISVIDEYPMFFRVRFRKEWSNKVTRPMKIMDFFRWYSMNHIQFKKPASALD